MTKSKVKLSQEFKTQTTLAITSIAFFAITYLIILSLAVGLTALCIYGGLTLIAAKPTLITIGLGIGLASLGILVLFFLIKFIFKSNKVDRSHLYEIKKTDEPKLFALIEEIVTEVNTSFPKKVYLSPEVNASVFYDSNFWSMFFPIKKNLMIGIGLVNVVNTLELKAVLAHEFGHFSQKTMKLGSYVYNVNQVIFNMLTDNESYDDFIQKWADVSGYFSIFVLIAIKIIEGIKWILRKLYNVVNKNYLGLSREMEFHADEIAASVTGFEPMKNALMRLSLADHSYDQVLTFYNGKIKDNQKSENLFKEHLFVMNFLADYNKFPIENNFPKVTKDELNRFNKSKLIIKDQWASHPSTNDRIERLEKTNFSSSDKVDTPANEIFSKIEETQKLLTNNLFKNVIFEGEVSSLTLEDYKEQFEREFSENIFSSIYNNYYDNKNPMQFNLEASYSIDKTITIEELFSDQNVEMVYNAIALQNDIQTLKMIDDKTIVVKTFDYDGKKYKKQNCKQLLKTLNSELENLNHQIKENDFKIFGFFSNIETKQEHNNQNYLKELYMQFFEFDLQFDSKFETYTKLSNGLQFVSETNQIEDIKSKFRNLEPLESNFKEEIKKLMEDDLYKNEITKEIRDNFELYLSKKFEYFGRSMYFDNHLGMLFAALNNYSFLLSRGYFLQKKKLLDYQIKLVTIN